jgi:hypothetical protein
MNVSRCSSGEEGREGEETQSSFLWKGGAARRIGESATLTHNISLKMFLVPCIHHFVRFIRIWGSSLSIPIIDKKVVMQLGFQKSTTT